MSIKARENEFKILDNHIKNFITSKKSNTIHITGVPGSGKTYTIKHVLSKHKYTYINCNNVKNKKLIYSMISKNIACNSTKNHNILDLKAHLQTCNNFHILVLDEIDLLYNKSQSILYTIYSIPWDYKSKILLITISNTFNFDLDAKIQSRIGSNLIRFMPYNSTQLEEILDNKPLSKTNTKGLTTNKLISRRVASISGDARKAIRIHNECKDLDILEADQKMKILNQPLFKIFLLGFSQYQLFILDCSYEKKDIEKVFTDFCSKCNTNDLKAPDFYEFNVLVDELVQTSFLICKDNQISSIYMEEEIIDALK